MNTDPEGNLEKVKGAFDSIQSDQTPSTGLINQRGQEEM